LGETPVPGSLAAVDRDSIVNISPIRNLLVPIPYRHCALLLISITIMAGLDAHVAAVVDRAAQDDNDSDEDVLIAALEEDDPQLDALRERRLQQLHSEYQKARELKATGHGSYDEIKEEKALMDITTSTKLCVVHFFKPDFHRCATMDTHLEVSRLRDAAPHELLL
jgi:hypothetical protein